MSSPSALFLSRRLQAVAAALLCLLAARLLDPSATPAAAPAATDVRGALTR